MNYYDHEAEGFLGFVDQLLTAFLATCEDGDFRLMGFKLDRQLHHMKSGGSVFCIDGLDMQEISDRCLRLKPSDLEKARWKTVCLGVLAYKIYLKGAKKEWSKREMLIETCEKLQVEIEKAMCSI